MKLTRPRKIAIVIVITAIIAPAALAILGLGDIVFDPTNFGKLVEQLAQMQQQYTQLVQTYQVVTAQYNQMIWMAKMIPANLRVRYRTLVTPWRNSDSHEYLRNHGRMDRRHQYRQRCPRRLSAGNPAPERIRRGPGEHPCRPA